ncbi:MAG: hypothetical protein GWN80_00375 [Gammaproteobacteria bacterium]|nr:hypothetical protein [Gammaproteobacteria bacterium]
MITGAIIDGDTIFIDPTDVSFPPRYSITSSLTGQPIINVSEKEIDSLDFLRKEAPTDHRIDRFIKLKYVDSTQFDVTSKTLSYNMQAGYRRSSLKQFTPGEFKSSLESSVSDSWGIRLVIDSVFTDPDYGVDTIFNERWYGRAFINIQDISDIRIIRMPDLSYFEKAFISRLTDNGSRELPVDLRDYCSSYNIEVTVETPESYGAPEIGDDLELADSLYSFKHYSEWNPESRRLILHYKYEISDGLTEPWGFISFVQKVTEAFDKPIVFKAE